MSQGLFHGKRRARCFDCNATFDVADADRKPDSEHDEGEDDDASGAPPTEDLLCPECGSDNILEQRTG